MALIEDILEVPKDCIVDSVIPKKEVFEARESKADYDKIVIEGKILSTNWMDIDNLNEIEDDFISKIQFDNLNRTDFYKFYNTYFEAVVQHDGAIMAGGIVNLSVGEIKKIYDEIFILDSKIKEVEKEISQEDNFNAKMDLNIKAHKFKEEKEKLINELKGE